jgi:hypothetical protein
MMMARGRSASAAAAALVVGVAVVAACGPPPPPIVLAEDWPAAAPGSYKAVTTVWTRTATLRGAYQEVLDLAATFKSAQWRYVHALRTAQDRGLAGNQLTETLDAARADVSGPYEVELLVTTWDRRENDLDRGAKSVWHVALVDEAGHEITPLEIVKDRRPNFVVRAEFPAFGDFATAYVARFPRVTPLLGPNIHQVRLRMSSERGGVEVSWQVP